MLCADVVLQVVVDALDQRHLGANHHHVDGFLYTERFDGLKVVSLHFYVLSAFTRSCIARSDIQLLTLFTLSNLPGQCVLTTATAQQ